MKQAMSWVMMALGVLGLLGIPALVTYGLRLGCNFGAAAGCNTPLARLWWRFLTGPEVLLFLVPMMTAAVALAVGLRQFRQVSAHRPRAGTGRP